MKLLRETNYRTSDQEVRAILDRPRWQEWIEYECELLTRVLDERGIFDTAYTLEHFKPDALEWASYQDEVSRGGHEIVCLLARMAEAMPLEHQRYLHRGQTSSNIIDTCNHRRWNKLMHLVEIRVNRLYSQQPHGDQPVMGMTHGKDAFRTTLAHRHRTTTFMESPLDLDRTVEGGPMGSGTRHRQCVQRSEYWPMLAYLAQVAYGCEQLATDYRFYCSDLDVGILGTMREQATTSSCMPGKVNPSAFERICSVGLMVRGLITTHFMQPPQWLDRDLVHSAMERETIDRIWDHTCWMLEALSRLVETTELHVTKEPAKVSSYDRMNQLLDEGLSYGEARESAADWPTG